MKTLKLFMVVTLVLGSLNVFAVEESATDCSDVDGSTTDQTVTTGTTGSTGDNSGNAGTPQ